MTKQKTNWEKEYTELKKNHDYLDKRCDYLDKKCDDKWYPESVVFVTIFLIILSLVIFAIIFAVNGTFDSPIDKLDIDKDALAKEHVIKYYPEYEDCNVEYKKCISVKGFCKEGVEIYCNKLDNRDGLKVSTKTEPTERLYFEGITLEEILINKINGN